LVGLAYRQAGKKLAYSLMHRIIKLILIWSVILVVMIFLHYVGVTRPIEGYLLVPFRPVQGWIYRSIGQAGGTYNNWLARRDLLAENEQLRLDLQTLAIDQSKLNTLEQENKLLQDKLSFVAEGERRFIAGRIISGVADPFTRAVIIDRGSDDGLYPGLAVVAGRGIMIGKLTEVNQTTSRVLLLSDDSSRVAATMQNNNRTAGLVEGQFGLNIAMTNIPQDQVITDGDLIVTSGLEDSIPKGLPIARVTSINQIESDIFKTAVLEPLITIDQISQVLVIIP